MKVKILIGVICFVVGAGAYYLYENNFSYSAKVEKCADSRPHHQNKLGMNLTDKLNDFTYRQSWRACESEAKKYPALFNQKY